MAPMVVKFSPGILLEDEKKKRRHFVIKYRIYMKFKNEYAQKI